MACAYRRSADRRPTSSAVLLRSLSGRDVTSSFPELRRFPPRSARRPCSTARSWCSTAIARPSASSSTACTWSGQRNRLVGEHPIVYVIFDLLELDGRSLLDLPLSDRRAVLTNLLDDGPSWRVPPMVEGDGAPLLALADDRGLEGVVAKKLSSRYEPGDQKRSVAQGEDPPATGVRRRGLATRPREPRPARSVRYFSPSTTMTASSCSPERSAAGSVSATGPQLTERFAVTGICPFAATPPLDREADVDRADSGRRSGVRLVASRRPPSTPGVRRSTKRPRPERHCARVAAVSARAADAPPDRAIVAR